MKYKIKTEKRYRRQYKLLEKRGYDMSLLDDAVEILANGRQLPAKYNDHPLKGDKSGYRDCHIQGNWVLIYKIDKNVITLILAQTGTHADTLE